MRALRAVVVINYYERIANSFDLAQGKLRQRFRAIDVSQHKARKHGSDGLAGSPAS